MTCIPFVSVKRSILGSASASGFGGGGAAMRSVRPVQKVEAAGPAGLASVDSYCTSIDPGEAAGLGGAPAAQPTATAAAAARWRGAGQSSRPCHPRLGPAAGGTAAPGGAPGGTSVTRVKLLSIKYLRATRWTSAAVTAR